METRTMQVLPVFLYISTIFVPISVSYGVQKELYWNITLEDYTLCSKLYTREVKLDKSHKDALLVTQTTSKLHPTEWNYNMNCVYKVKASNGDGIFAVIQSLSFRQNADTGECIDHVQFRGGDGKYSQKYCGIKKLGHSDTQLLDPLDISESGYIDSMGKMRTTIFISKDPLPPGMFMDLQIVYTTFHRCNARFTEQCIPDNSNYCYRSIFKQDGYVNCPFRDCGDETSCDVSSSVERKEHTASTRLYINAGMSLVIPFLVFIVLIWLCKKTHILCFHERCLNDPRAAARATAAAAAHTPQQQLPPRVIEMENRAAGGDSARQPAAGREEDKDLPPSYDSLFDNNR